MRSLGIVLVLVAPSVMSAEIPPRDRRNVEIRHTDTHYSAGDYTRAGWETRARFLRKQVQFSAGLLPMPPRSPLNPLTGQEIVHEDYTVTSVLLETYPGYFLGGNLYRPTSGEGPFPAMVSPHGHWRYGRFEHSELNSVPTRAISFARQGYVVFAYDMVGWNDTMQAPHGFAGPREELWLLGTLGLQLWNSIRVVDYLVGLPDVDRSRVGVTGASGGGTQAFLLAAVDDRIGYSAPVNMVSFQMQGGSRCENAPLLRVGTNNVEIAAAFAPKPQLLVAATGDWTVDVPREEYPAVQSIYGLLDAASNVEWKQFDSPHNYHQDSREAVYAFFGRYILGDVEDSRFVERSVRLDQLSLLLYLWGRPLPEGALSFEELVRQRIAASEADTLALAVRDRASLERAQAGFGERLGLALLPDLPEADDLLAEPGDGAELLLGRVGAGDRIPARFVNADSRKARPTLVVHAAGRDAAEESEIGGMLVERGVPVLFIDAFQTGSATDERDVAGAGRRAEQYYHVFNRSDDANRVQDILTALAFLRGREGADGVNLVGIGRAGLWVLLAAALDGTVKSVVADLDDFDATDDSAYVDGLFVPGLRRAGDFRAVAPLVTGSRTMLHNAHESFPLPWFESAFDAAARPEDLSIADGAAGAGPIVEWIGQ